MNITDNHNIGKRVDYALANLKANDPHLFASMDWEGLFDLKMSKRLRRCAGRCIFWKISGRLLIEFSESLFNTFPEMEKTDTVIHELAHAVCFRLNLERGHGHHFKRICRLMGGSGERLVKVGVGVVKRNLVKRWVMVRTSDPSKLYMRTKLQADDFKYAFNDGRCLGVIQMDRNRNVVKWVSAVTPEIRGMNPLEGKFKLEA